MKAMPHRSWSRSLERRPQKGFVVGRHRMFICEVLGDRITWSTYGNAKVFRKLEDAIAAALLVDGLSDGDLDHPQVWDVLTREVVG